MGRIGNVYNRRFEYDNEQENVAPNNEGDHAEVGGVLHLVPHDLQYEVHSARTSDG
jgi:hypothetical protein